MKIETILASSVAVLDSNVITGGGTDGVGHIVMMGNQRFRSEICHCLGQPGGNRRADAHHRHFKPEGNFK